MKKILAFSAIGILCFVMGLVGIYIAMPSVSPDKVSESRSRLDSLGLLGIDPPLPVLADSIDADSTDSTAVTETLPTPQDIIQALEDSIIVTNNLVRSLRADTMTLNARLADLIEQLEEMKSKDFDAAELSKSLAKLDVKQLGGIIASIDLETIELLYEKASARERTRLLESMSPEQAARFVRTLVNGPLPEPEPEAETPDADPTAATDEAPSNQ